MRSERKKDRESESKMCGSIARWKTTEGRAFQRGFVG